LPTLLNRRTEFFLLFKLSHHLVTSIAIIFFQQHIINTGTAVKYQTLLFPFFSAAPKQLKKLFTIFLLLILLWLQFSKQFTYFHCKVTQTFSVSHCNCEDMLAANETKTDNDLPNQKTNLIIAPDEFYTAACNYSIVIPDIKFSAPFNEFKTPFYKFCFYRSLLRPPCC